MSNIFDVAKYILKKCGKISTWKLQKLCFYSQAWSLAWTERTLFENDFEAWSNGPVCPELFHAHQGKYSVTYNDLYQGNEDNLSADDKDTIDTVLDSYKDMDPYDLREQTHSEQPWIDARGNTPPGEKCTNIISKDSMGEYYGSL